MGDLARAFNQMIEDLRVSREKLIQAERLAAWQQVARQISHEIRNSLTPISVSLRRFRTHLEKEGDPKKVPEILKTIQEEIRTMESMAAEFSDFARMPAPKKSTTDLNELIQSVVRLMSPATGQVNIKTQLAPDLPDIETDGDLIKRLLNNLIKNAVEASHDTGTVTVTTASTDGSPHRIILTVEDRGEGMDEETLENIFQPYYTTKRGGTGLGLVIVRKIVEDHGGEISVKSEKDAGTRFSVHL